MIRIAQHVPGFVEVEPQPDAEGDTQDEVLSAQWIQRFTQSVESVERQGILTVGVKGERRNVPIVFYAPKGQAFIRFSLSEDTLIAEYDDGSHWVVGFVRNGIERLALPTWQESEVAKVRREAWNRGEVEPPGPLYRCAEHGIPDATCCCGVPKGE